MMVEKTSALTLIFTSADGRAKVEVGTQLDFSYTRDSGAQAVVSLPLTALATLGEVVTALLADADVQALIPVPTPEPEPEPDPPVEPEPEVAP